MNVLDKVIEKIEVQQKAFKEGHPAITVGEQLKDICRAIPAVAEIVMQDLDVANMNIDNCEKKIKALADERHKKNGGSFAFVSPLEAEKIIKEFYGIQEIKPKPETETKGAGKINLDFDNLFA